ncbi:MAG: ExeM/NucH family extracellular endonuclease, partial [Proteobacteria bacterium]|nr:ExeM/NucH family extracellular endonuclease [Burkholderiales bacterium]
GSSQVSATDFDSIVNFASITGGAVAGITLGSIMPASADGGRATARIEVADSVAQGSYPLTVTFSNNELQNANCAVTVQVIAPPMTLTPIYTIQGTGPTSPLVGQSVTTRGVVSAVLPGLLGYFIQDETGDGNPLTSDGIFVFNNAQPLTVTVGERIQVSGTVTEFDAFVPGNPSVTEIINPTTLAKLGMGPLNPVPIAFPETTEGELERYEGMLVVITTPLTVSQNFFLGRYGQLTLSSDGRLIKPTNAFRPGTPQALAAADANARRRLVLDDGQSSEFFNTGVENPNPIPYIGAQSTVRAGDVVTSLIGVLDFGRITSGTGEDAIVDYKLHPVMPPNFARVNNRTTQPPAVGGNVRVASFNVLNYFTTFGNGTDASGQTGQGCLPGNTTGDCRGADNLVEFERQRTKIVQAIVALDADIVGLIEIQRNGTVAMQNLVDALNTATAPGRYAVIPDPASGVGTDAIKVGFIHQPLRATPVGGALSDTSPVHNRPPVAQTFQTPNGAKLSVIVNHFKSKGCDGATGANLDQGDGQGCFNDQRKLQAAALLSFVSTVQQAAADTDVLVIGDLNAYGREDPIDILNAGGLADQLLRFSGSSAYSFVFDGEAGYLDHALATASLAAQITGVTTWAINADEPSVIDYNTEFKPQDLYAPTAFRSSDHDPVLVGLSLTIAQQSQTITFAALADRPLGSSPFPVSASASSGLAVSFSTSTSTVCTVNGNTVTLVAAGTCTILADQAGNATFAPAPQVSRSFQVSSGQMAQSIDFAALAGRTLAESPFAVSATASSGLTVTFSSGSPSVCSVSGTTVTLATVGECVVQADQAGNASFAPATAVVRTFTVSAGGGPPNGNVPMPPWALLLLAVGLLWTGVRGARVVHGPSR